MCVSDTHFRDGGVVVFSYFDGMLRYFELGGRSSRRQYWLFALFSMVLILLGFWADFATGGIDPRVHQLGFFSLFALIVHVIPGVTVTVRRLHDSGRSGFWYLLNFVPFGGLVLLVFMCLGPTGEAEKYGDDPRLGLASRPLGKAKTQTRSQQIVARLGLRAEPARISRP
jgi:uncharacterized membrane protein YhaH (DUF805 family)